MGNMMKSGMEGEKQSRTISVGNSKHQEYLKIYGKLPDYYEFQAYDLGIGTDLSQIDGKSYANPNKPSWETSRRHFFMEERPKKLFRAPKILDGDDKRGRVQSRKNVWAGRENTNSEYV